MELLQGIWQQRKLWCFVPFTYFHFPERLALAAGVPQQGGAAEPGLKFNTRENPTLGKSHYSTERVGKGEGGCEHRVWGAFTASSQATTLIYCCIPDPSPKLHMLTCTIKALGCDKLTCSFFPMRKLLSCFALARSHCASSFSYTS